MNVWTIHERSATWKTDSTEKVTILMQMVADGWITVPHTQKEDGIWTIEVYVPINNNFHQTLQTIRKLLS